MVFELNHVQFRAHIVGIFECLYSLGFAFRCVCIFCVDNFLRVSELSFVHFDDCGAIRKICSLCLFSKLAIYFFFFYKIENYTETDTGDITRIMILRIIVSAR
eukprot:GHVL01014835.1.p2 GENE.GHVL01014835.1~~GHVL01014835.1.p2  ORF type:complete len:103 (+),score=1.30 GHVL01014835.1:1266-1574(+)